jgi:hypothetical protein
MSIMDQEFSDELTGLMPVVPHGTGGADCSGRIIAAVEDDNVELQCDRCGAVVGVVQVGIMEGLLGLDCEDECAPLENTALCTSIEDTCRWYSFGNEEPIAVARCTCGRHPDVDDDCVHCPCGRKSYVGAPDIIAAIAVWNAMSVAGK